MKFHSAFAVTILSAAITFVSQAQADDLVAIKLKGTSIDVLPDSILVLTDNPKMHADALVAQGAIRPAFAYGDLSGAVDLATAPTTPPASRSAHDGVIHYGVSYAFETPESYNLVHKMGHTFKDGDVIYTFSLKSKAEQTAFLKKYRLTVARPDIAHGGHPAVLYVGKPGYYVDCQIPNKSHALSQAPHSAGR